MRAAFRPAVVAGLFFLFQSPICAQGILGEVREDIRPEDEKKEKEKKREKRRSHSDTHSRRDNDWFLGVGFVSPAVTARPRPVPARTIEYREIRNPDGSIEKQKIIYKNGVGYEEIEEPPVLYAFPAHPYPFGLPGYMQIDPTPIGEFTGNKDELLPLKWWSVRLSIEDGWDFDSLNRLAGNLQAETLVGLGVYTSWNWFHERLRCGCTDDATIGNVTITWRALETKCFLFRFGVGAWIYADDYFSDSGGNFHLSADIFPAPPWVISGVLEFGGVGDTHVTHVRATVGYLFDGIELYGGYDFLQIGRSNLDGPLVGVRVWF